MEFSKSKIGVKNMYLWVLRKGTNVTRVKSRFKMILLRLIGWKCLGRAMYIERRSFNAFRRD